MPGLHSRLRYSSRLLARCERDKVHTNVDIYTLVQELSIMGQDIRDILISFDSGMIYRHVSESFETRREQNKSVEDETNVPFTLSFSSSLTLFRWECKPGIQILPAGFYGINLGSFSRLFEISEKNIKWLNTTKLETFGKLCWGNIYFLLLSPSKPSNKIAKFSNGATFFWWMECLKLPFQNSAPDPLLFDK